MAFKYTTTTKPVAGTKFSTILKDVKANLNESARDYGNRVRGVIEGQVVESEIFFKKLEDVAETMGLEFGKIKAPIIAVNDQQTISKRLVALRKTLGSGTVWQVDHKTMAPINQQTSLLIVALVDMIQNAEAALNVGVKADEVKDSMSQVRVTGARLGGGSGAHAQIKGLKTLVNELRKVRAFGEVIEKEFEKDPNLSPKRLKKGYQELMKGGQIDITAIKDKDVGIVDGQLAKFQIITESNHKQKSDWQRVEGALKSKAFRGTTSGLDLDEQTKQNLIEAEKIIRRYSPSSITGSKAIEEELGKQFADTFVGKKPKRRKTSSKQKVKTGKIASKPLRNTKRMTAGSKLSNAEALITTAATRTGARQGAKERDSGSIQKELNKLRTAINRRLSAEVRRNMGRPALINRTGIFSNSVKLLNLRQAGKTVVGEYSYMLTGGGTSKNRRGVYSTFENLGTKRWPLGYNPKPLIAKSIRNLAQEYTDKKFTLRRV